MKKAIVTIVVLLAANAQAQFADLQGASYTSKSTSLQIIVLDDDNGVVAVSAGLGQAGCSGEIAGIGKINGSILQFKPYKKEEEAVDCVMTVKFDKTHKKASIQEDGCSFYHGASCAWEGQSMVKKK